MSVDPPITSRDSTHHEAQAIAACLVYLERSATDAGLAVCARFISLAAAAAAEAASTLENEETDSARRDGNGAGHGETKSAESGNRARAQKSPGARSIQ